MSKKVDIKFQKAFTFHQRGQLMEAAKLYETILKKQPNHFDSMHLLGLIFDQIGQFERAVDHINKAIQLQPDYAEAYSNRGNALLALNQCDAAIASYDKAIQLKPDYAEAYSNRGNALLALNQCDAAIASYCKSIDLDKTKRYIWSNFAKCIAAHDVDTTLIKLDDYIANLLTQRMIAPNELLPIILKIIGNNQAIKDLFRIQEYANNLLKVSLIIENLNTVQLFLCIIKLTPISNFQYENSLCFIRKFILINYRILNENKEIIKFQQILAQQCFINEYVYFITDEESKLVAELETNINNAIANKEQIDIFKITTLATYNSLNKFQWAKNLYGLDGSIEYLNLLRMQITESQEESSIRSSIDNIASINNQVSQLVQAQYEENPYPRWTEMRKEFNQIKIKQLFELINSNPVYKNINDLNSPEILVAGCGTGQHSISTASRFSGSNVTAVDLSLSSLSYAIRKTNEYGIKNIKYLQADILNLETLNKQFDIVESIGVLHHMANPLKGWKTLVNCTKPNGLMRIGLYSEIARKDITNARKLIKKKGLSSSNIRSFRNEIFTSSDNEIIDIKNVSSFFDFYSTSMCRDLLFHVQEYQFNLIQIDEILNKLGLAFLAFEFPYSNIKDAFRQENPSGSEFSLLDWHQFELNNPNTFISMYQFWVIKKEIGVGSSGSSTHQKAALW